MLSAVRDAAATLWGNNGTGTPHPGNEGLPILPLGPAPAGWTPPSEGAIQTTTLTGAYNWTPEFKEVETCGQAFLQRVQLLYGVKRDDKGGKAGKGGVAEEADVDDAEDEETFRFPKKLWTEDDIDDMDYYMLIGLGHLAMNASQDLIKRAYRKALLLYHPDKTGRGDRDEVFIAIQKAYETLSDEKKKRAYDSELDFDEAIPTGRERGDFYKIYAPVFERNARFAMKRPVPNIGNKDTPMADVYKFYDYWERFESWRDFTLKAAEYNLEEAESREEKRWMIKENDKKVREAKKKEYKRLATLVERAKTLDPRIIKDKEMEKIRKEEAKAKKEADQKAAGEEAKRAAEEAKRLQEEEEKRAKEEKAQAKLVKEQAKKRMRMARGRFRAQCDQGRALEGSGMISEDDTNFLCEVSPVEVVEAMVTALGGMEGDFKVSGVQVVLDELHKARTTEDEKTRKENEARQALLDKQKEAQAALQAQAAAKETPWTPDELSMLAKSVVRFPAGTQKRWQLIADYINQQLRLTDLKTKETCIKQYQLTQAAPMRGTESKMASSSSSVASPAATATTVVSPVAKAGTAGTAEGGGGGTATRVVKVEGGQSEEDVWSQGQQKQLEAGLIKFPASMEKNERWKGIAEGVEGKNKKQCIERYKSLRAALQQQKKTT